MRDHVESRTAPPPGGVWADPVLRWCAAAALVSTSWFVLTVIQPVGPAVAGWLLAPVVVVLGAVTCWRAGGVSTLPAAARSFWRRAGVALAVFSLSMVSRIADSLNPDLSMTSRLSMLSAAGHAVAVGLLMWPLLKLPLGSRSRAQRTALALDMATVMVAAGVFVWHLTADALVGAAADGGATSAVAVALIVIGLTSVLIVVKVALTGTVSLPRASLGMLGAALAVGGLGSALTPLLAGKVYLDTSLIVVPVAVFLIALGARLQVSATTQGSVPAAPRRRFSVLPYVAVIATDVLMLVAIARDSPERLAVAAAAVGLTGLVVVRQFMALKENGGLLTRLDAGLLELRRTEQRFRSLVQNATDVVSISEPGGALTYISPSVQRVLGRAPADVMRDDLAPLVHPDDREIVAAHIAAVAGTPGTTSTYQIRMAHADGSWRWLEVTSANLVDDPSVGGIVSNSRDITETRQVQERLSYEASHDALTGLANRALFTDRLHAGVGHHDPAHRISVVLIDLDDFKTVNDTLGHAVGDGLLVAVAGKLRAGVRPADTVARLGGDEFAILFDGLSGDAVERVLRRLSVELAEPVHVDGHRLAARASFGVVEGRGGDDPGTLLRHADIAMYEAKEAQDGGLQRYEAGMQARGAERSRLAAQLRTALEQDQLVLHYQPVVTLPGGRLTGVEALVRWQHPTDGLLGPGAFIPAAEQTGLIVPVGRWVLRQATRQAATWLAAHGDDAPATVAVNVSAHQLRDATFSTDVARALVDSGLPAHRLIIEITESTAVDAAAQRTLRDLRRMGVRLSLDDFGTGASTLSLLADCPVDQIKLDRSFAPAPGSDAIATAVVQLARAFGIEAVAEGVETPAQAEQLTGLGYEHAQGFHFARPMPPQEIEQNLMPAGGIRHPARAGSFSCS